MSFALFVILSLMGGVSAETCYSSSGYYYCSLGQSCGSYYGDCQGLSSYAIAAIVFASITLCSVCIRCCIRLNARNVQSLPPPGQNVGTVQVQVHSISNNAARVPAQIYREQAPPTYAAATSSNTEPPKY